MIFDTNNYYDDMQVGESPYPLGLEGALMHVYENECNYNALMRAVGISELKYYKDTGKSLFVHEAGAFSGFLERAKAFFKKVIEKIKQIFHKFAATLNQYFMKDKEFVKKYSKEILRKDITDFDFDGYTFKDLDTKINICKNSSNFDSYAKELNAAQKARVSADLDDYSKKDSTAMDAEIEKMRGGIISSVGGTDGRYDESEFRDELHELLYGGDKETLDKISPREQLQFIENTKKDIKEVERVQKDVIKIIDRYIKDLEKWEVEINKKDSTYASTGIGVASNQPVTPIKKDTMTKTINNTITYYQAVSNTLTIGFGMVVQAVKDRNRQAKAICVKIIGYKHEAVKYSSYSESSVDDLFAGVTIR